ncbi:N-6 DNA methylase [Amycolatopsis aidingensis]|uniref:N-6 DNA methylase n=1 Tax=Amycolatopsis aidingensis TaxID=2842453 RepID=UPI001C0DF215|nr:N-6 DNA methylase [Amycolatopsis aidingensis]
MSHDTTVNAGDIARLVHVGKAAVSNWRRRHEDFPRPVGGTASSPRFSLREVEDWLRRNGKSYEVSLADRVWQRLRASTDDLGLGRLVGSAGALLLSRQGGTPAAEDQQAEPIGTELGDLLTALAAERGAVEAFEFLCRRYLEEHSRRLSVTPSEVANLLTRLVSPRGGTVFDPACGAGTLLLAGGARQALGQDSDPDLARIAAMRLLLRGVDATVLAGDSLRQDAFPGTHADAVVCDPPFNERAWGHPELAGDLRWEYGLPPRGEPELAWVQHCLAHVRPGGLVAVLMPGAAAGRRPGKRIRGNLLRAGALRAVVSLPDSGPDLWLLRRPEPGERPPSRVLLLVAEDLAEVATACLRQLRDPEAEQAVPILELLDDEVDLSPARYQLRHEGSAVLEEFTEVAAQLTALSLEVPGLTSRDGSGDAPFTTVGELAREGMLTIQHAPARNSPADDGDLAMLTTEDLLTGGPPSGRTAEHPGQVMVEPGDVVASASGAARVAETAAVLGPHLARYRVEADLLDPDFLAGILRAAAQWAPRGSGRIDPRRARLPRLPLDQQRRYGAAFRQLTRLEDAARQASTLVGTLVRLGFGGLAGGRLAPRD